MAIALLAGTAFAAELSNSAMTSAMKPIPPLSPMCATGFTTPTAVNPKNPYGQSYTCTGPAIVCLPGFKPEDSVAGTIPPGPGQLIGQTIYGSPVTIKNGRMVYTCGQPPAPPK